MAKRLITVREFDELEGLVVRHRALTERLEQLERDGRPPPPPAPAPRGSSTPPRAEARPEVQPNIVTAPPPPESLVPPRRNLAPGSTIPSPQGGTVAGGGAGD